MRGLFVTFEGIDGSGKSTQARLCFERLRALGHDVVLTREPGGSPGAEEIRSLLVRGDGDRWSPETEMTLFNAARRDHVERTIRPALERGAIVLCDRYVDSTRGYQGGDPAWARLIELLHDELIGLDPDLTVLLTLSPEEARSRDVTVKGSETRFEARGDTFMREVQDRLLDLARAEPDRFRVLDGAASVDEVCDRVLEAVLGQIAKGADDRPDPGDCL
jgi:dTMP kinase